jgi:hypothetical protein
MARRPARQRRALRLWSSGWLALFLVLGLLWIGDTPLQWAVLGIPLVWALPALLSRGRDPDARYDHHAPYPDDDPYGQHDSYDDDSYDDDSYDDPYGRDDMDTREVRYTRDPHGRDAYGRDPYGRDDDPGRRGGYGSPR